LYGADASLWRAKKQFKDKDLSLTYVSLQCNPGSWQKAMNKLKVDGLHIRDGNGGWNGQNAKLYGIAGIPAYYLIDKMESLP
jgi:hypothetical protein